VLRQDLRKNSIMQNTTNDVSAQITALHRGGGREAAREAFNAAREAIASLERAGNCMGRDIDDAVTAGLVDGLAGCHRHLQAQLVLRLIKALGELPGVSGVDGRNAHAHKACEKIKEALGDQIAW